MAVRTSHEMMEEEEKLSPREIARVDPRRIDQLYDRWPADVEDALKTKVEIGRKRYDRVVYLAVGGSATAGDIISDWFLSSGGVEVSVFTGNVPRINLDHALVIVCSTSGDTEETLKMAETIGRDHPDMVAISAGGKLRGAAEKQGIVHVKIKLSEAPRYSLPYSLFASVAALRSASLLDGMEWELEETVSTLKKTREMISSEVPIAGNPSKQIASMLSKGEPCIFASSVTKSVGRRFKTCLNENSKMHAAFDSAPDFLHNEVEAWERPDSRLRPIFLRRANEPAFEARALDAFIAILEKKGVKTSQVAGTGTGNLSQLMSLCYILDVASYYTAILRGVDPFGIGLIDELKKAK
jgi:glucose/mannose-6-phosphate isomerase